MSKVAIPLLFLSLLPTGCDSQSEAYDFVYDTVIVDSVGIERSRGTLNINYLPLRSDRHTFELTGEWRWNIEQYFNLKSGPLGGHVDQDGRIFVDFQLWRYATDTGTYLDGFFDLDFKGDFSGRVLQETIIGIHHYGDLFTSIRR